MLSKKKKCMLGQPYPTYGIIYFDETVFIIPSHEFSRGTSIYYFWWNLAIIYISQKKKKKKKKKNIYILI